MINTIKPFVVHLKPMEPCAQIFALRFPLTKLCNSDGPQRHGA